MNAREIVQQLMQQLVHEDPHLVSELTRGCDPCQKFARRLRRKPEAGIGLDEVPEELLERFYLRLHQRLFLY